MRKWGVLVTGFYFVVVAGLLLPGAVVLVRREFPDAITLETWLGVYQEWMVWLWIGLLVGGEALLLFLSVDASHKRLQPRQHALASVALIALMVALLTFAAAVSLVAGVIGEGIFEEPVEPFLDSRAKLLAWIVGLWGVWGVVFWSCMKSTPPALTTLIRRLLKGSVLELLIAVPAHVIVRHREDCSAPVATSFGIATGLAVMLFCFGPGVLFLYRERVRRHSP